MSELLDELHAAHAEKYAADTAHASAVRAWREATWAEQTAENGLRAAMDATFLASREASIRLADARAALRKGEWSVT